MPTFVPVDHDPFATTASPAQGYRLEPVDHDPFAADPASDVSKLSDAELMRRLGATAPSNPLASMSDADLMSALGQPQPQSQVQPAAPAPMEGGFPLIPPGGRVPIMSASPTNPTGQQMPVTAQTPGAQAFWRGAGQGASFGAGDEIAAAGSALTGGSWDQSLEASRAANKAASTNNPWSYTAGQVVGGIAGALPAMAAAPGFSA